ncbi:Glycine receptor subunit alphaZ1-like protein [Leptotrombidium deliense]|uniref:Glycine receptor subunit alphaZ1-like protein n=1 Tax=Leptotrombidium deliense TaxID=299467 RepID=A0A443S904_9ACAR|nr:Glycine receptor subunit alphaZ1-like protein [Leptotrombidium deliense]
MLLLIVISYGLITCHAMSSITKDLVDENYDVLMPPKELNQPVIVNISIFLINIRSISAQDLTFTADMFLHQTWFDKRLKYPKWLNESSVTMHASLIDKIWIPDIYFKDGIGGEISTLQFKTTYFVFTDKNAVFMVSRLSVKLVCQMNFAKYPHDSHTCSIALMSLAYHNSSVTLRWKTFRLSSKLHNPDYAIEKVDEKTCDKVYDVGSFSCVTGIISLVRNAGHFYTKYLPSFTIVIASFASFWIPSSSYPARASIVVTSMLALITQQLQITSDIKTSYFVSINIWMNICTTIVFCCLLEYAIALVWESKQKRRKIERAESKIGTILKKFEKHEINPIDQNVLKYLAIVKYMNNFVEYI